MRWRAGLWVYLWIQVVALVLLGRELSVRARISDWSDLLRGGRSDVQLTDPGATQNGLPLRGGKGQHWPVCTELAVPDINPAGQLRDYLHAFIAD